MEASFIWVSLSWSDRIDYMMTERQQVVSFPEDSIDARLASFIADVLELAGLFRQVADDIARQAGQSQALWYALSVFSSEPLTVSQAARRLGTTRQAVQRSANKLLARGLATTEPNPDHRASPFIVLTPKGRETLAQISQIATHARKRWFADRDAARLEDAHSEIRRLRDALRRTTDRQ
jgi:DNA-binding MarR family transcriptional regulator